MPILLQRLAEIREHWQAVANDFANTLPRTGGTYRVSRDISAPGIAILVCTNFRDELAVRYGGTRVTVVPFLQTTADEMPRYWLGWYEEWHPPTGRKSERRLQYRSSAITIYYGTQGERKRQLLRAEWAGAEYFDERLGRYIFQADGAAHPHWHVNGIRGYFDDLAQELEKVARDTELCRDIAVDRVRDFGNEDVEADIAELITFPSFPLPSASELSWTTIHLAANARWCDNPWRGPTGPQDMHANTPSDCIQIRRWLISCVRYLQAEIESNLIRGRH